MRSFAFVVATLFVFFARPAFAESDNPLDLPLETLLDQSVSTAAKYEQTVGEAPAWVNIVPGDDIRLFGYHTLEETYETPGGFEHAQPAIPQNGRGFILEVEALF